MVMMRSLPLASGSAMVMLALLSFRIFLMRWPPGPIIAPASSFGIVTCLFYSKLKYLVDFTGTQR
jgi:CHASE2 domain-containing sensor protein